MWAWSRLQPRLAPRARRRGKRRPPKKRACSAVSCYHLLMSRVGGISALGVLMIVCVGFVQAQAPSFTAAGFVNAAASVGHNPPAVARGELVTIFGANLSTSTQFIPLGSSNPTQLPGSQTRVLFGNIPAPLLYV